MSDFQDMIEGYRRFKAGAWSRERARWEELAHGQSPKVLVIACSDSRVDPTRIFDSPPGEMFVVRNVANLVPPMETGGGHHGVSAALEFGVTQLEVSEIVVMGHGACGGASAALSQRFKDMRPGEGGYIANWIDMLRPARDAIVEQHGCDSAVARRAMEEATVKVSLANLRTFPCIRVREREGKLRLHGAYFAIADGVLHVMNPDTGEFAPA